MEKKEKDAIELLGMIAGNSGCVIADSGGKDSSVIKHIALKAKEMYGLDFKVRHNHTTVDAPETVYFVREEERKFIAAGIPYEITYPKESMWQLIPRHGAPPTRLFRYCCADLKENTGKIGERLVTGVRKAESQNRKKNQGIITIPKPKKALKTETENNTNFQLTNKGGGCSKFRQRRNTKNSRKLFQNTQNVNKSIDRLGRRFFVVLHKIRTHQHKSIIWLRKMPRRLHRMSKGGRRSLG